MSWFVQVPGGSDSTDVESALKDAIAAYRGTVSLSDEALEQIDAAAACAVALVDSGAVGTRRVSINLSGHANTDHTPDPGWANDCITVAVTQMTG